jgi:hypothetical protein
MGYLADEHARTSFEFERFGRHGSAPVGQQDGIKGVDHFPKHQAFHIGYRIDASGRSGRLLRGAAPDVSLWFAFLNDRQAVELAFVWPVLVGHEVACIARPDLRQAQQGQEVRRVEVRIPCGCTADLRAHAQIALQ